MFIEILIDYISFLVFKDIFMRHREIFCETI